LDINFDKTAPAAVKNNTMKKLYLLLVLFVITQVSFSQGWQWKNAETQSNIVKDQSNNLYIFANTSSGIFIKKRDLSGNILWTKSINGGVAATAYKIDASNNLILLGNITTMATVDNDTLVPKSSANFFILKMSSSAIVISANVYGDTAKVTANDLYINANGEYLIGGGYTGNFKINGTLITGDTLYNFLILKTDPNQNVLWWETNGYVPGAEGSASVTEIVETGSGNICAVYQCYGLVDFKGQQNSSDGQFMVQLDAARNMMWTNYQCYCWMWYESYYGLQVIGDTVYMKSFYRPTHSDPEAWINRWTPSNVQSTKYMGNTNYFGYNAFGGKIYFAAICPDSDIWYNSSWYRHIGFVNSNFSGGLSDSISISNAQSDYYSEMSCVDSSHFYIGGMDSALGTFVGLFGINYSTLAIDQIVQRENIIFPNPSTGIVYVSKSSNVTYAKVYNSGGHEVECFLKGSEIDFGTQPKGIYFIELQSARGNTMKKIILE
jgi:hypothetical protein